jgi:hypothetical protein
MGLGRQNLINIGNTTQGGLWIGFDENDHFVVSVDGQTMISDYTYETLEQWAFYTVSYHQGEGDAEPVVSMVILSDASELGQDQYMSIYSSLEGSMYVGYCPYDGSAFYGNIHELRIWNYARNVVDIAPKNHKCLMATNEDYIVCGT